MAKGGDRTRTADGGRETAPAIRPARAEDAGWIAALARLAYARYVPRIGREPAPMLADFPALIAAGAVWCLQDAGYIVLHDRVDSLHIENVAVHPDAQGRGLGRVLLDFAEAEARRRGHRRMDLYTNVHMRENLALYPALGWRETGRRREAGFERVYFGKSLAS